MSKRIKTITRGIFFSSFLFFHHLTNAYSVDLYSLVQLNDYSSVNGLNYSYAYAINNSGEVVGESLGIDFYDDAESWPHLGLIPLKWDSNGNFQKLGFVKTEYSMFGVSGTATAINDGGVVVGQSGNRAFIWNQTNGIKEIEFINATDGSSKAIAINNNGTVVGHNDTNQYYFWDTVSGHKLLNTNNLAENTSVNISSINNNGVVVGSISSLTEARSFAAIGTQQDGLTRLFDLPHLVGSSAAAVNDLGQVVGSFTLDSSEFYYQSRPFFWDPVQGLININIPEEFNGSQISATAINNSGSVLGTIAGNQVQGFIWDITNGFRLLSSITDLINKPSDFGMAGVVVPLDINDMGQILISSPVAGKVYILSPVLSVPEPENLGMLLAGLGVVVFMQRRRKVN
ncbi:MULTISPECIES: PEP-CTERM sorting domain-containing protein [unclassified Methylophilus]|uniref:PEP-CTERM sorting domain-containing protein n=1 Tax=unclassified Methylophilus TaxID=2630143 RepID=UPI000B13EC95|nr:MULTISPECIES: PEP-CTERM sorting domain-containing protein [unclassified Methylophilus]